MGNLDNYHGVQLGNYLPSQVVAWQTGNEITWVKHKE